MYILLLFNKFSCVINFYVCPNLKKNKIKNKNKPNLNVLYKKQNDQFCNHDFIMKNLFKDNKKLISYYFLTKISTIQ